MVVPAATLALLKQHFQWLTQSLLDRAVLWWAPESRIRRLIQVEGDIGLAERTWQAEGRATMWLCPHFVGLDVAGAAILLKQPRPGASIYQAQSHPLLDRLMKQGRLRFGDAEIFPRQDSIKPLLRAVKAGRGFFNLPDMDFGMQDAAFVPFFGVPAATLLAPSRLARCWACSPLGGSRRAAARVVPDWALVLTKHRRHEARSVMFVVLLHYVQPIEVVERLLEEHRTFLDRHFAAGRFIASGAQVPRVGGVILARGMSRQQLDAVLAEDPFLRERVADYQVVEFNPTKVACGAEAVLVPSL